MKNYNKENGNIMIDVIYVVGTLITILMAVVGFIGKYIFDSIGQIHKALTEAKSLTDVNAKELVIVQEQIDEHTERITILQLDLQKGMMIVKEEVQGLDGKIRENINDFRKSIKDDIYALEKKFDSFSNELKVNNVEFVRIIESIINMVGRDYQNKIECKDLMKDVCKNKG